MPQRLPVPIPENSNSETLTVHSGVARWGLEACDTASSKSAAEPAPKCQTCVFADLCKTSILHESAKSGANRITSV